MLRFLLWFLLLYIIWRIARSLVTPRPGGKKPEKPAPPFSDIEEAKYEDLTDKRKPGEQSPPAQKR